MHSNTEAIASIMQQLSRQASMPSSELIGLFHSVSNTGGKASRINDSEVFSYFALEFVCSIQQHGRRSYTQHP